VFIRVIRFSDKTIQLGSGIDENARMMMFNVYFPNADIIMYRNSINTDALDFGQNMVTEPVEFELPVDVLNYDILKLYKPKLESTISPNDVGSRTTPPTDTDTRSELDKPGGIKPLLDRFKGGGYGLGGKKLRSAKKTSKRRSVKSKPRHYRRSVGSINRHLKKTTRRRRR
jgi:hypothetical protein